MSIWELRGTARVSKRAAERVRRGHPWIYRSDIDVTCTQQVLDVYEQHQVSVLGSQTPTICALQRQALRTHVFIKCQSR